MKELKETLIAAVRLAALVVAYVALHRFSVRTSADWIAEPVAWIAVHLAVVYLPLRWLGPGEPEVLFVEGFFRSLRPKDRTGERSARAVVRRERGTEP